MAHSQIGRNQSVRGDPQARISHSRSRTLFCRQGEKPSILPGDETATISAGPEISAAVLLKGQDLVVLESRCVPSTERFEANAVKADKPSICAEPQIAISRPEDLPDDRLRQAWDLSPVVVAVFRETPARSERVSRLQSRLRMRRLVPRNVRCSGQKWSHDLHGPRYRPSASKYL